MATPKKQRLVDDRLWELLRAWQAAGVWDRLQQCVLDELAPSRCEQVLPRLLEVGICRNRSTRKLPSRVTSSSWLLPTRSVRMTTVSRTPFSTITDSARDHRAVPRLVRRSVEGYPGYQPGRPRATGLCMSGRGGNERPDRLWQSTWSR